MMIFILATGSFLITVYLAAILAGAFRGQRESIFERFKFNKFSRRLGKLEEFKITSSLDRQIHILNEALCLDVVSSDTMLVEQIHAHHQKLIKVLMAWLGEKQEYSPLVEVLDDLLVTRTALLRGLCDAVRSTRSIRQKKKSPDWAVEEYRKKEQEYEDKLAVNKKSIKSQAERFVRSFSSGSNSSDADIVVH